MLTTRVVHLSELLIASEVKTRHFVRVLYLIRTSSVRVTVPTSFFVRVLYKCDTPHPGTARSDGIGYWHKSHHHG